MFFSDTPTKCPQRTELMSLNTIKPSDGEMTFRSAGASTARSIPPPADIEGSKPCLPWKRYLRGSEAREPIEGSTPRTRYPPVNRVVDLSMATHDIAGATKRASLQFVERRTTNPLTPRYDLPTSIPLPAEPLPFRRHSNYIADIEGTSSKSRGPLSARRETDSLRTNDIRFATPRMCHREVTKPANPSPERVIRPRETNPLNPEYKVSMRPPGTVLAQWSEDARATNMEPATIGRIPGNAPKSLQKDTTNRPCFALKNNDISGSTPRRWIGSLALDQARTHDHLSVRDIAGCQADSRRRTCRR